jgi:hypothetical protein
LKNIKSIESERTQAFNNRNFLTVQLGDRLQFVKNIIQLCGHGTFFRDSFASPTPFSPSSSSPLACPTSPSSTPPHSSSPFLSDSAYQLSNVKQLTTLICPINTKRTMAELNEIVLLPVGKEDFEKLNEIAEALLCHKYPSTNLQSIKGLRNYLLKQFRKFQQEQTWLSDLENDIQNNVYFPKLLRRHSI